VVRNEPVDWGDEEEEDNECDGPADFARRGFLQACRIHEGEDDLGWAKRHAEYFLQHPGEIDDEILDAAEKAAREWQDILRRLTARHKAPKGMN
jgi:hypothetical protein